MRCPGCNHEFKAKDGATVNYGNLVAVACPNCGLTKLRRTVEA